MPELNEWEEYNQVDDDVFDEGDFILTRPYTPVNTIGSEPIRVTNHRTITETATEMERQFFETMNRIRQRDSLGSVTVSVGSGPMMVDLSEPEPTAPRHFNRSMREANHKPAKDKKSVCEVIIDDILDI